MLLDLPRVTDGEREIVAITRARRRDQRARMVLGAAAVPVDHVQHAVRGRARNQRAQAIAIRRAVPVAPAVREPHETHLARRRR